MLKAFVTVQNLVVRQLRSDDRGATAVEYGLIVALIAAVVVVAVGTLGTTIDNAFKTVLNNIPVVGG